MNEWMVGDLEGEERDIGDFHSPSVPPLYFYSKPYAKYVGKFILLL